MLYPRMNPYRKVFDLSGIWDFKLVIPEEEKEEPMGSLIKNAVPMPVPSSYNDIYPGRKFADHVGKMVYQRKFSVTEDMKEKRLVLRFGSAAHQADVWLNGKYIGSHKGGFLPFSFEIGETAKTGENLLTVYVDNVVDYSTLPCGRVVREKFPGNLSRTVNLPNFDFYNYTGLLRPVWLYTTAETYIRDIEVYGKADGSFFWKIETAGKNPAGAEAEVTILDRENRIIFQSRGLCGEGTVADVRQWSVEDPCLYRIQVDMKNADGSRDRYTEEFGFRDITIENCRICLNGKPVYLKGFGKHEEGPFRGRATDTVLMTKDLALLKWIGANSFRTSHYPNSEEMLQLCDRFGILVIDEAPAVGLNTGFTATGLLGGNPDGTWKEMHTAEHHRTVLWEMVARDKNHPCVIAWSVANEPASQEEGAKEYFEPLVQLMHEADVQHRPVTIVTYKGSTPETCRIAELCDFLMLNRYQGWYDTEGNLEGAAAKLKAELEAFHRRCPDKPVMLGEFGADTIAGFHDVNERMFTEEYQTEFMKAYTQIFDSLPFIAGEHVWCFADFATAENVKRVDGNKKGIFARDRKPKQAAYYLRGRWKHMGE